MKPKKQEELFDKHQQQRNNNNKKSDQNEQLNEVHKAVAQAWHSHFTNARVATSEFDARRRNFKGQPSRFKLEATNKLKKAEDEAESAKQDWDFTKSLWDSYEIVTVSKRLESGLVLGYDFDDFRILRENTRGFKKKRRESKRSLRNLFNSNSSRRFNDAAVAHRET